MADPERRQIRECAQEIISAHVVTRDHAYRDRLINEYAAEHRDQLAASLMGLLGAQALEVYPDHVAGNRFEFVVTRLCDHALWLAKETDRQGWEVVFGLCAVEPTVEDEEIDVDDIRAAQACVLSNYIKRQHGEPWGIQGRLGPAELRRLVEALAVLWFHFCVTACDEIEPARVVRGLLDDVEVVVRSIAAAVGQTTAEVVARYFAALAMEPRAI